MEHQFVSALLSEAVLSADPGRTYAGSATGCWLEPRSQECLMKSEHLNLLPFRSPTQRLSVTQCEPSTLPDEPCFSERLTRQQVMLEEGAGRVASVSNMFYGVRHWLCAWGLRKDARIRGETGAFSEVE